MSQGWLMLEWELIQAYGKLVEATLDGYQRLGGTGRISKEKYKNHQ